MGVAAGMDVYVQSWKYVNSLHSNLSAQQTLHLYLLDDLDNIPSLLEDGRKTKEEREEKKEHALCRLGGNVPLIIRRRVDLAVVHAGWVEGDNEVRRRE